MCRCVEQPSTNKARDCRYQNPSPSRNSHSRTPFFQSSNFPGARGRVSQLAYRNLNSRLQWANLTPRLLRELSCKRAKASDRTHCCWRLRSTYNLLGRRFRLLLCLLRLCRWWRHGGRRLRVCHVGLIGRLGNDLCRSTILKVWRAACASNQNESNPQDRQLAVAHAVQFPSTPAATVQRRGAHRSKLRPFPEPPFFAKASAARRWRLRGPLSLAT
jgi:hypothetical protein